MNPDEERARLTSLYSSLSDEELERIADSGDELTAAADQALHAEIVRRGLMIAITPAPAQDIIELGGTVTLRKFRDLPEALLAKGSLESAGIEVFLVDDNMIRMDWFISNLLGGIKLQVRAEDAQAAEEILSQPIPETMDIEGVGDYEQPKCPKCQSLDVSFRGLDKLPTYGSAALGVPVPIHKEAWLCYACGHEWEDENPPLPETDPETNP